MALHPLRRSDQTFFFGVPGAYFDGPLWFPTLLQELAQTMYGLEHCSRAAVRIDCAVDPRVAVIACDHPVVRLFANDGSNHIPDGAQLVILFEVHVSGNLRSSVL